MIAISIKNDELRKSIKEKESVLIRLQSIIEEYIDLLFTRIPLLNKNKENMANEVAIFSIIKNIILFLPFIISAAVVVTGLSGIFLFVVIAIAIADAIAIHPVFKNFNQKRALLMAIVNTLERSIARKRALAPAYTTACVQSRELKASIKLDKKEEKRLNQEVAKNNKEYIRYFEDISKNSENSSNNDNKLSDEKILKLIKEISDTSQEFNFDYEY